MPEIGQQIVSFGGGVNASQPAHLIGEDQVASATNIDFSYERGAATVRRGNAQFPVAGTAYVQIDGTSTTTGTLDGLYPIKGIYRLYQNSLDASPFYVYQSNGSTWRLSTGGTFTKIATLASSENLAAAAYRDNVYIADSLAGGSYTKDDGTNATEWLKQTPATPTITISTLAALAVPALWGVTEGTSVSTSSGTAVFALTSDTFRGVAAKSSGTFTLNTNGSDVVGDLGVHSVDLSFTNPSAIKRITQTYYIGGGPAAFQAELEFGDSDEGAPEAEVLVDALLNIGTATDTAIESETRDDILSVIRDNPRTPRAILNASKTGFTWLVPRTAFRFVGAPNVSTEPWNNITNVEITVEGTATATVTIDDLNIYGGENYPLTDVNNGYSWWQTFATIDSNGFVVGESAPSDPSARTRMQNSRAVVVLGTSPTGTAHGITHRIIYRQGGYMPDAYAVATVSYSTATITDTVNDVKALSINRRMPRNLYKKSTFVGNITAISEPFAERLFVASQNRLLWSAPGTPDVFPKSNITTVSHTGDEIYGVIPWASSLVIVNRDSVYEMQGNEFDGKNADWVLQRSGARHGSKAKKAIIKTPYGIPLLDYEGLFMYIPGQGVDQEIPWLMEKMGDSFRGNASTAPTALKGTRLPAINQDYIRDSLAAYGDGKLYLVCATGSDTVPRSVFVIDFRAEQVYYYYYNYSFYSLFWDSQNGRLLAGTTQGYILQLETGITDQGQGITWSIRTRTWTTPSDTVLENMQVEFKGFHAVANIIIDNTATSTLGTFTNTVRDWNIPSVAASVANNFHFTVTGVQGTTTANTPTQLTHIAWEALPEPKRVVFWRTEHDVAESDIEKQWDVHNVSIEVIGTGSVFGTVMIDNTAVMTHTITGPTNGRILSHKAFPADTTGNVALTTFTSTTSGVVFKLWRNSYITRPEPPRLTTYKSDVRSGNEFWWKTHECDINPLGTATATVFVDNVAVSTHTMTGTKRQSFVNTLPADIYGRTIYALYSNATRLKHYVTWFDGEEEPDRMSLVQVGPRPYPSGQYLKTWLAELNPLGTCTAILYADDVALSTATFTGTYRHIYPVGLDVNNVMVLQTASTLHVDYYAVGATTSRIKHYNTAFETTPKPFGKSTWAISYKKVGGASQLDHARFWSYDIEAPNTIATITSIWDVDGLAFTTNTFTVVGRQWRDRIPFPPGARGQLFQQRLISNTPIMVWRSNLDTMRVGIKGLSRSSIAGTPNEN
jgi:hypothetical protein